MKPSEVPYLTDEELDKLDTAIYLLTDGITELEQIWRNNNNKPKFFTDDVYTLKDIFHRLNQIYIIGDMRK